MKTIGIFMPGRLESERLPNKLILPLGDSNLWNIACRKLNSLPAKYKKYVLINDTELISIARRYPNITIIRRDPATTIVDGPLQFIFKEIVDMECTHLMFLNPCLSLLSEKTILQSLAEFENSPNNYATSVKAYKNWLWGSDWNGDKVTINALIEPEFTTLSTKDIPKHYEAAHCFHIFNKDEFLADGQMLKEGHLLLEVPKEETMDVDDCEDYKYAKFRLAGRYVFDLDGTICDTKNTNYSEAQPFANRIEKINQLYDAGNYIIIDTARGSGTGIDQYEFTKTQLKSWNVKYHELRTGIKPYADYYIDDKAFNSEEFLWK